MIQIGINALAFSLIYTQQKDQYDEPMALLEAMREGPQTSKLYHYRQEDRPSFWSDEDFGPFSPSSIFGLALV